MQDITFRRLTSGDVTVMLRAIEEGDAHAAGRLLPLVYDELRRVARRQMAGERPGQTLQPTALVHEAYIRLTSGTEVRWTDRTHFLRAAARAMRRILVDRARHRATAKAGGDWERVDEHDPAAAGVSPEDMLAVMQGLEELARLNERLAAVVELRYLAGLSAEETARALNVTVRTVTRDWTAARTWLYRRLTRRPPAAEDR